MEATAFYLLSTCVGAGVILCREVSSVDLADPKDCLWWFKNGCLYTGVVISSGFGGEYLVLIGWISVPRLGRMWWMVTDDLDER